MMQFHVVHLNEKQIEHLHSCFCSDPVRNCGSESLKGLVVAFVQTVSLCSFSTVSQWRETWRRENKKQQDHWSRKTLTSSLLFPPLCSWLINCGSSLNFSPPVREKIFSSDIIIIIILHFLPEQRPLSPLCDFKPWIPRWLHSECLGQMF